MSKDADTFHLIDDLVAMYILLDCYNRKKESEERTVIKAICKQGGHTNEITRRSTDVLS